MQSWRERLRASVLLLCGLALDSFSPPSCSLSPSTAPAPVQEWILKARLHDLDIRQLRCPSPSLSFFLPSFKVNPWSGEITQQIKCLPSRCEVLSTHVKAGVVAPACTGAKCWRRADPRGSLAEAASCRFSERCLFKGRHSTNKEDEEPWSSSCVSVLRSVDWSQKCCCLWARVPTQQHPYHIQQPKGCL